MTKSVTEARKTDWAKPELVHLGKIADVAGAPAGNFQNATKS